MYNYHTPQRENPDKEKGKKNNTVCLKGITGPPKRGCFKKSFFKNINLGKLPGKMDILNAIKKEPCLANVP
ncbi:hypothetical protein KUTeg_005710 [Tegillarca granosa]|uniref:Uncharacterized protein n=1 Tax=Tegillarca granosa TaxID=220873 RepID=A0ABQ9FHK2_TEGGR|nr:hypothetical protein KUTeg_005710 [Tegillarca granosa]